MIDSYKNKPFHRNNTFDVLFGIIQITRSSWQHFYFCLLTRSCVWYPSLRGLLIVIVFVTLRINNSEQYRDTE